MYTTHGYKFIRKIHFATFPKQLLSSVKPTFEI